MLGLDACIACVRAVIMAAAINHYVDPQLMDHVAYCETGGTYNRYAVNGQYRGIYQLGYQKQLEFYSRGYTDLNDPAQQANFAAEQFHAGAGRSNWVACGGY